MTDEPPGNLIRRLLDAAEKDPALRAALRAMAEEVLGQLDAMDRRAHPAPTAPATTPLPAIPQDVPPPPAPTVTKPTAPPAPRVQAPLRIGDEMRLVEVRAAPEPPAPPGHRGPIPVAPSQAGPSAATGPAAVTGTGAGATGGVLDPPLASRRCTLKAEAARWAIERRRRVAAGDREVHDRDRDLFARAKALPNCYLWMMDPKGPPLPEDAVLDAAAGCYDTLARAVTLVAPPADTNGAAPPGAAPPGAPLAVGVAEELFEDALYLLAEAQSALRAVLAEVLSTLQDWDQREVFFWLRRQTAERGIYISRFMRMDDAASPDGWQDLRRRVDELRAKGQVKQQQRKARQSLMGKARYHAKHLTAPDAAASAPDWQKLTSALEDLVRAGVPPSDVEIRDLVVPLLEDMPDDDSLGLGPGMRAILSETERYLEAREGEGGRSPDRERTASPEVRRVAEMLRGRTVVLIGGEARPHAKRALEQWFQLDELDWISTQSHQSVTAFEPAVARPETAVVLLAIRWSSHSFGEVKSMCDRYGKPFVRLPGGYNPDQVARQILEQVSGRLETGASGAAPAP